MLTSDLYGDWKNESDLRNHVQKISMTIQNQNGITSLTKF